MTIKSKIFAAGMSLVFIAGSIMPAQAFTPVVKSEPAQSGSPMVVQVQGEDNRYRWRHDRRFDRRERFDRRYHFDRRDRWDRRDRYGYYNGHRGYRDRRPGYREYNGYWFPLAAFGAGALLGGAVNSAPRDRVDQHSTWCLNRYRSYDVRSNTYQPNNGPRRACVSPY